jgi:hypothetical protein
LEQTEYSSLEAIWGKCTDAWIIQDPSTVDPGFFVKGFYADFKPVVKGEEDFLAGVVRGKFKLRGVMTKNMRSAKFVRAVAKSIRSFESEYLGE